MPLSSRNRTNRESTVQRIHLGELLCERLPNAEDAPTLQFAMSPDEVSK